MFSFKWSLCSHRPGAAFLRINAMMALTATMQRHTSRGFAGRACNKSWSRRRCCPPPQHARTLRGWHRSTCYHLSSLSTVRISLQLVGEQYHRAATGEIGRDDSPLWTPHPRSSNELAFAINFPGYNVPSPQNGKREA